MRNARLNWTINRLKKANEVNARPDYEAVLEARYSAWIRPGDTVLDVGAHIGRHLSRFAELVGANGQVIAFEPLPCAYAGLVTKFTSPHIQLHNIALAAESGVQEFVFNEAYPEESGLRERIYNSDSSGHLSTFSCRVETLDSVIPGLGNIDRIDYIKLDIEGGEIDCLNGAREILNRFRPVISVEYGAPAYSAYGHTKSTLYKFAYENGYILYDLYLNSLASPDAWDLACDSVYWDYFMVPRGREREFRKRLFTQKRLHIRPNLARRLRARLRRRI